MTPTHGGLALIQFEDRKLLPHKGAETAKEWLYLCPVVLVHPPRLILSREGSPALAFVQQIDDNGF